MERWNCDTSDSVCIKGTNNQWLHEISRLATLEDSYNIYVDKLAKDRPAVLLMDIIRRNFFGALSNICSADVGPAVVD